MKEKLIRFQQEAKLSGLHINVNTTKEMRINTQIEEKLSIANKEIEQVELHIPGKHSTSTWRNRSSHKSKNKKSKCSFYTTTSGMEEQTSFK
jgi:hypothetical protein